MSVGYRFYLLDESDHIAAVRVCDCPTDANALLEADAVLQRRSIRPWKSGTDLDASRFSASQQQRLAETGASCISGFLHYVLSRADDA
jgi:hypothetical protein